jgi:hypothetical protein
MSDVEAAFRSWADDITAASAVAHFATTADLMGRAGRRRRGRVLAASTSTLLATAVIVVIIVTTGFLDPGRSSVQVRATPEPSSVENRFVPVASSLPGGDQQLVVPFLDGRTVTASYPTGLKVASLGMTASVEIAWAGVSAGPHGCCQPNALAVYTELRTRFGTTKPIQVFSNVPSGEVDLMPGDAVGSPQQQFLVFTFGHWLVEIPDAGSLGAENLATLAANLSGSVDAGGFLRLSIRAPLTALLHPSIVFGAATVNSPQIEVTPQTCSAGSSRPFRQGDGENGVAVCDSQGVITASATGPNTFVDQIAAGLELRSTSP